MPNHQVIAPASTIPSATVAATLSEMKAPRKLRPAAATSAKMMSTAFIRAQSERRGAGGL
ncbi:MAG TPA: hypothetical protein VGI73_08895 [Solirubrobacterales bacterium]|jgi:hypothetical protein